MLIKFRVKQVKRCQFIQNHLKSSLVRKFLFNSTFQVRTGNLLKTHVSEICVKQIRVIQGSKLFQCCSKGLPESLQSRSRVIPEFFYSHSRDIPESVESVGTVWATFHPVCSALNWKNPKSLALPKVFQSCIRVIPELFQSHSRVLPQSFQSHSSQLEQFELPYILI